MAGRERRRRGGGLALALACAALAGLCGCKTIREELEPVRQTTLTVARAGGEVTLSWIGQRDVYYSVMYSDSRGAKARWQLLPDAVNVRGMASDEPIVVMDRLPPAQPRYYRLVQDVRPLRP